MARVKLVLPLDVFTTQLPPEAIVPVGQFDTQLLPVAVVPAGQTVTQLVPTFDVPAGQPKHFVTSVVDTVVSAGQVARHIVPERTREERGQKYIP